MGTNVSPRYANAHPTGQHSFSAQVSPHMASAVQAGRDYSYPGFPPLRNTTEGGNPPQGMRLPLWLNRRVQLIVQVHSTPRSSQRHRVPGTTSMGLSSVQGFVAGTPRMGHTGTPRVNTDPSKRYYDPQPQRAPNRFSGMGLGPSSGASRDRASGTGHTNYDSFSAPPISSRGKSSLS